MSECYGKHFYLPTSSDRGSCSPLLAGVLVAFSAETLSGNCSQLPHARSQPTLGYFHMQCLLSWRGGGVQNLAEKRWEHTSMEFPTGMAETSTAAALESKSFPYLTGLTSHRSVPHGSSQ